jgi:hypothetical protein
MNIIFINRLQITFMKIINHDRNFDLKSPAGNKKRISSTVHSRISASAKEMEYRCNRSWTVPADENGYFVFRSFNDLDERQKLQDAFYNSDDWQKGPRSAILAMIENMATVVVSNDTIKGLIK